MGWPLRNCSDRTKLVDMGTTPDAIKRLVERFNNQADQIRSPDYNETLIRIDFINPFMRELGWDIDAGTGLQQFSRYLTKGRHHAT